MTSTAGKVLIAGGVLGALWYFNRFRVAGNLQFFPGNIDGMQFAGSSPVMDLTLVVANTSGTPVSINSVAGGVYSDNTLVGNFYTPEGYTIPANSRVQLPVSVDFFLLGLVNEIIQAFQMQNFRKVVTLDGSANVEGLQVPIKMNFNVGL